MISVFIVQWGWPTVNLTSILAMLPALFANIVESVANYYTCARFASEYIILYDIIIYYRFKRQFSAYSSFSN